MRLAISGVVLALFALAAAAPAWAGAERELACDQDWVVAGANKGEGLITITNDCGPTVSLVVESTDKKGNPVEVGKVGPGQTISFFFRIKGDQTISILGADDPDNTYTATIDPL